MITFSRTASTTSTKFPAALSFAREIAGYMKTKAGIEARIEVPVGANPHRVRWVVQYQSLAAMEQAMNKLLSDPKYLEMAGKGGEIFIPGATIDEIFTGV